MTGRGRVVPHGPDRSGTPLSGDDSLTLPMMALGAKGRDLSDQPTFYPGDMTRLVALRPGRATWPAARERARSRSVRSWRRCSSRAIPPRSRQLWLEIGLLMANELRLPLCPISRAPADATTRCGSRTVPSERTDPVSRVDDWRRSATLRDSCPKAAAGSDRSNSYVRLGDLQVSPSTKGVSPSRSAGRRPAAASASATTRSARPTAASRSRTEQVVVHDLNSLCGTKVDGRAGDGRHRGLPDSDLGGRGHPHRAGDPCRSSPWPRRQRHAVIAAARSRRHPPWSHHRAGIDIRRW